MTSRLPADDDEALSPIDQEALERAVELMRAEGGDSRNQIEQMLRQEPWERAAGFAVDHCQEKNLRLRLWQPPPSWISPKDVENIISKGDDGALGHYAAALLLKRLLAAGLSQFEPDPERALAEAKAKRLTEEAEAVAEALALAERQQAVR